MYSFSSGAISKALIQLLHIFNLQFNLFYSVYLLLRLDSHISNIFAADLFNLLASLEISNTFKK